MTYEERRAIVVRFSDGPHGVGYVLGPNPHEGEQEGYGHTIFAEIKHPDGDIVQRTIWVSGTELVF